MEYREFYVLGQDLPIVLPERQVPSPAETCQLVGHLLRQSDRAYRCSHCGYETDRAGMLENAKRIDQLRSPTPSPTKESVHVASTASPAQAQDVEHRPAGPVSGDPYHP